MNEYVQLFVLIVVIALIWHLAHRGSLARHAQEVEQRAKDEEAFRVAELERRADFLRKHPEPTYTLSADPELAELEQGHIACMIEDWPEFYTLAARHDDEALAPYLPAGEALTLKLRKEIIEAFRRSLYLQAINEAKTKAASDLQLYHSAVKREDAMRAEALKKLEEFKLKSRQQN